MCSPVAKEVLGTGFAMPSESGSLCSRVRHGSAVLPCSSRFSFMSGILLAQQEIFLIADSGEAIVAVMMM